MPTSTLTRQFTFPRRFDPTFSVVGRLIRHAVRDTRRAEAFYILFLTGLCLAMLLSQYLGWALLQEALQADVAGTVSRSFWVAQVAMVALLVGLAVIGFRPRIRMTLEPEGLHLTQGKRQVHLRRCEVESVTWIDPLRFHRHERRYAATQSFIDRLEGQVLLLATARGPVALALPHEAMQAVYRHLTRRVPVTGFEEPVRAA